MSLLLLKAKEPASNMEFELRSTGTESVEPEIRRFFRIAPDCRTPDVNPFGRHDGALQYLTPGYERRGTYTHLYANRALSSLVDTSRREGRLFVRIPADACNRLAANLSSLVPLKAAAAFLLRKDRFQNGSTYATLIERFKAAFNLNDEEVSALFERNDSLEVEFSEQRFVDGLDSLPLNLRPRYSNISHASASGAAKLGRRKASNRRKPHYWG